MQEEQKTIAIGLLGGLWSPAIASAQRFQESTFAALGLIRSVYRQEQVTFEQLCDALISLGLDPHSLYHELSAGYETPQLNQLARALGLPEKSLCCMPPRLQLDFEQAMMQLVNQAGESSASLDGISEGIRRLAEEVPQPAKLKQKVPYYQKDKQQWWKGKSI